MFERSCREMLNEIERHESLANELRHLLLSSPGKLPDAATAASKMRLGERTLAAPARRRRHDVSSHPRRGALSHRHRLSRRRTHLSTQEIAELLGFSEATNFRRAFMRWTQRSPTSYRKPLALTRSGDAMIHSFDGKLRSQRPLQELATVFDLTGFDFEIARGALRSSEMGLSVDATSSPSRRRCAGRQDRRRVPRSRTTCCVDSRLRWKRTAFHLHCDCWTPTALHGSPMNQIVELPAEASQALTTVCGRSGASML